MKKNDELVLEITDLNEDGDGVAKCDGLVFFVKGAIPKDVALCGITALKKNYGYARVIEIVKASPDRVDPICNVAGKCGGCSLLHMSYQAQLAFKEKRVWDCLVRIGGFPENEIQKALEPVIGMEEPFGYRNKAQYPVGYDRDRNPVMGFYAKRSHRIVESVRCHIGHSQDIFILDRIRDYIKECKVPVYDEKSHKGLIRHILIRHSSIVNETMVCFVINGKSLPKQEEIIRVLSELDGITSISVNINTNRGNVILGDRTETIYGNDRIRDGFKICGKDLIFEISPQSFYQVNPTQMVKLYEKAIEYAGLTGDEFVWDLYCGIGTITLSLAINAKEVLGIEEVPAAIEDAKINAEKNGINNAKFFCGKAEDVMSRGDSSSDSFFANSSSPDVVVLDPPRAGCDPSVLSVILNAAPNRIVYVSCNPATLARDLKILCAPGSYEIQKITPVDQFCHGMHVETVCLLSNRKADSHIKLSLDMDEYYDIMDKEKAEKK